MNTKQKTILLLLLLGLGTVAHAQHGRYRTIDLAANILSPKTGDYIKSPTTLELRYSVINHGPDTVFVEDSFDVTISISAPNFPNPQDRHLVIGKVQLLPGDSVVYSYSREIDFNVDTDWFYVTGRVHLRNRSPFYPFFFETTDNPTSANNGWQVILKHRSATSSVPEINKENLSVFPNPTDGKVNVRVPFTFDNSTVIKVQDMNGRTILQNLVTEADRGRGETSLTLPASLSSGFYWITVQHSSGILTEKILVQKEGR